MDEVKEAGKLVHALWVRGILLQMEWSWEMVTILYIANCWRISYYVEPSARMKNFIDCTLGGIRDDNVCRMQA